MHTILAISALTGLLGTIVLAGVRERFGQNDRIVGLQVLCVAIWFVSAVLLSVFFPGNSTPDPRF